MTKDGFEFFFWKIMCAQTTSLAKLPTAVAPAIIAVLGGSGGGEGSGVGPGTAHLARSL